MRSCEKRRHGSFLTERLRFNHPKPLRGRRREAGRPSGPQSSPRHRGRRAAARGWRMRPPSRLFPLRAFWSCAVLSIKKKYPACVSLETDSEGEKIVIRPMKRERKSFLEAYLSYWEESYCWAKQRSIWISASKAIMFQEHIIKFSELERGVG